MQPEKTIARFQAKYHIDENGCWIWTGSKYQSGYGQFWDGERYTLAHLFSLRISDITVPEGRRTLNTCGHRDCVNPEHWFVPAPKRGARGPITEYDDYDGWIEKRLTA